MPARTRPPFPTLETRRLLLRSPEPSDTAPLHAILSKPESTRFSNWPDQPGRADIENAMRWMGKLHGSAKGCAWMIEERKSGLLVGAIRINRLDGAWRWGEIGYESNSDFWGRGLMTEALRAVTVCAHGTFGLNRLEAWTLPGNDASDRVLAKAGFVYEGTLRQKAFFKGVFHDFRMFARTPEMPRR